LFLVFKHRFARIKNTVTQSYSGGNLSDFHSRVQPLCIARHIAQSENYFVVIADISYAAQRLSPKKFRNVHLSDVGLMPNLFPFTAAR